MIMFDLEFLKKETHQQYIVYFFGIVDTSLLTDDSLLTNKTDLDR